MAKTVVPIELSSTPGIVDNSNATAITIDSSEDVTLAGHIVLTDSKEVKLGASTDMRIAHDGTDSFLTNNTGDFYLNQLADDKDILLRSDDGSGGIATYLTIDGSATKVILSKDTKLGDNIELQLGNDNDFILKHNATNSVISTDAGDLILVNNTDDKDIILKSDDGSGGTTAYVTVDGSATKTVFSKNTLYSDSIRAQFGDGGDMSIFHNATDTYIQNATGTLIIENTLDDSDIDFKSDDGSGGTTSYLKLDGSATTTVFSKNTRHADNALIQVGDGNDAAFYHNSSDNNTYFTNDTGDLKFRQFADDKDIIFDCDDGSGSVARYLTLDGSAKFVQFDQHTKHSDAIKLDLGNSSDLQIYHSGSHSYIENNTGDLVLLNNANDKDIFFLSDDGAGSTTTYFQLDGSAATHDGSSTTATYTKFPDKSYLTFGDANDLQIYHDGSNSYVADGGTGHLILKGTNMNLQAANGESYIFAAENAGVTLYYDGSSKLATNTNGVEITGNLTATGNLTVSGTTTTVNSTTLDVADLNITVGKSATTSSATDGAGLTFGAWSSGTIPTLTWDHSNTRLSVNKPFHVTGALTSESLTVDDITIDGSTISDSGDITIDSGANITLDADGGAIGLNDGGTHYASFENSSNSLYIETKVSDKDIILRGNDGGSTITALTLDMSDAGTATFNHDIILGDGGEIKFGDSNDYRIYHHSNGHTYVAGGSVRHGANTFRVMNLADTETQIEAIADGAVSLYHNGNKKLLTTSTGVRMDHTSDTDYSSTGEPAGILTLYNSSGSDGAGVNNYSSLEFNTGDGATSQGFINYIRTADNQGRFAFSQRTASSTYAEAMTIDNSGNVGIGITTPNEGGFGATSSVLSIAGTAQDAFGVLELISTDVTSSNRIGEIRFGNLDAGSSFASNAGMRATRDGADNSSALSLWYSNAGTFTQGLYLSSVGTIGMGAGSGNFAGSILINNDGGTGTLSNAYYNTGFGWEVFDDLTTGDSNTAIGNQAGYKLTEGTGNTMLGRLAGETLTTGSYNTAIGYNTMGDGTVTADGNTCVGNSVGVAITSGARNTAVGQSSLQANTSGNYNVAIGDSTLQYNTNGGENVMVGFLAGNQNGINTTSIHYNTGLGSRALYTNASGAKNTAVGAYSLHANVSGANNVGVGYQAGYALTSGNNTIVGNEAGSSLTSGNHMVCLGYKAGAYSTDTTEGSDSVIIGAYAHQSTATAIDGDIVIGYNVAAASSSTRHVTLGYGSSRTYTTFGTSTWSGTSDSRLKENIAEHTLGLNFINALRPVTFNWKKEKDVDDSLDYYKEGSDVRVNSVDSKAILKHGFIAQEVKTLLDNNNLASDSFNLWSEMSDGTQGLADSELIPIIVKGLQELDEENKWLKSRLDVLAKKVEDLENK